MDGVFYDGQVNLCKDGRPNLNAPPIKGMIIELTTDNTLVIKTLLTVTWFKGEIVAGYCY